MKGSPLFFSLLSALLSATFLSCNLISDPQKKTVSIVLGASDKGDLAFYPNPIIVPFGGSIEWTNNDKLPHTVISEAKHGPCAFDSDGIRVGGRYQKIFSKRGICRYYCGIHGKAMRGKIIIR